MICWQCAAAGSNRKYLESPVTSADETSDAAEAISAWEAPDTDAERTAEEALLVDVAGFEGPLDLLLALARTQKVDIARISMVALVDQYLKFIAEAEKLARARRRLSADGGAGSPS